MPAKPASTPATDHEIIVLLEIYGYSFATITTPNQKKYWALHPTLEPFCVYPGRDTIAVLTATLRNRKAIVNDQA